MNATDATYNADMLNSLSLVLFLVVALSVSVGALMLLGFWVSDKISHRN